jgi:UDP-2-acetamido-2,6-beta-L-arabino-hexul-4-ose reductase
VRRVAITGGRGFLGWHTRAALHERGDGVTIVPLGEAFDRASAITAVDGADEVIHLAGVNRGTDDDVRDGNALFAEQLGSVIDAVESAPALVTFAGSVQSDHGGVYGDAKAAAGDVLARSASRRGGAHREIRLPNLFGEHGRPFYNAVTATFCHSLAEGGEITVDVDRELTLLHVQDAADVLIGSVSQAELERLSQRETVSGLADRLRRIAAIYERGEVPDISIKFARDLFNTYRSYLIEKRPAIPLTRNADSRGSFFEVIRSHGGHGQSSFSTTVPGISRGDHYHRRKVERFTVLSGTGVIELRRLFGTGIISIPVNGEAPVAVDMPTMWAHRITNTGSELLYTSFWTDDLFDPLRSDTIQEIV